MRFDNVISTYFLKKLLPWIHIKFRGYLKTCMFIKDGEGRRMLSYHNLYTHNINIIYYLLAIVIFFSFSEILDNIIG